MSRKVRCLVQSVCWLAVVSFANPNSAPAAAIQEDSVVFEMINLPRVSVKPVGSWSLVPSLSSLGERNGSEDLEEEPTDEWFGEFLLDLIRNALAPDQWEMNGRFIGLTTDQHTLIVRAPQEVVESVRGFVRYMTNRLCNPFPLELTVYRVEGSADVLRELSGLGTDRKDIARVVNRHAASGNLNELFTRTLMFHSSRPSREHSQTMHQLVADYDIELANTSATSNPVTLVVAEGVEIIGRVVQTQDGRAIVDFSIRLSSLNEIKDARLEAEGTILGGDRLIPVVVADRIQSADTSFAGVVSRVVLGEGESVAFLISSDVHSSDQHFFVRLDADHRGEESTPWLNLGAGRRFGLFDLKLLPLEVSDVCANTLCPHGIDRELQTVRAGFSEEEDESFVDLARTLLPALEEEDVGLMQVGPWVVVWCDDKTADGLDRLRAKDERNRLRSANLEGQLIRRTKGGDEIVATFGLPVTSSAPFMATSGNQWTAVVGYDVEVARRASVSDPYVNLCYDAVSLRGEFSMLGEDRASLHFSFKAQLLQESPRVFVTEHTDIGQMVQPTFREIWVERDLQVVLGREVTIEGLTPSLDGDEDLTLRLLLRNP